VVKADREELGDGEGDVCAGSIGIGGSVDSGEGDGEVLVVGSLVAVEVSRPEFSGVELSSAITGATTEKNAPTKQKAKNRFKRYFGCCEER